MHFSMEFENSFFMNSSQNKKIKKIKETTFRNDKNLVIVGYIKGCDHSLGKFNLNFFIKQYL